MASAPIQGPPPGAPQIGMRGLRLLPNHFTVERGGTLQATNCVIPSKDVMESRRGMPKQAYLFGSSTARARAMHVFNGVQLVYRDVDNALAFDTGAAYTDLAGTYLPPAPTQLAMRFAELSKSCYFTTSLAPYALSAPTTATAPRAAGLPRVPGFLLFDPTQAVSTLGTGLTGNPGTGWMSANSSVTYRALLGLADANNVIRLSAPSGRIIVPNPADVAVQIGGLVRTGGVGVTATVTGHGYRAGDVVTVSPGEANFPAGTKTITAISATTFQYAEAGANASSTAIETFTSGTKNVQVSIQIPAGLTAGQHFVQLYRSLMSPAAGADPGDETRQVFERFVTATDITNGYVVIQDTCPQSQFLGPNLYTNPISGQTIDQSNTRPPIAQDICVWDSRMWYAATTDRHRLSFRILGIGSPSGFQAGDVLCVGPQAFVANSSWQLTSQWSPSQNISLSMADLILRINSTNPIVRIQTPLSFGAYSLEDGSVYPASVALEETGIGGARFFAACSRSSAISERLPAPKAVTAASTVRISNTVTVTAPAHGFAQGDVVMVASASAADANFPLGVKTVSFVLDVNNFEYIETGSNATLAGGSLYYAYAATYGSSNNPLQLRYSKQLEPESVPLLNYPTGLPDNASVLRIAALRDKLYVFLKDGDIYTVSGTYPYQVVKLDGTAQLIAAETLVEHSGRLHCLTTQGVVAVSDGGVEVLGYDVEPGIDPVEGAALSAVRQYAFAVSYESERQYQLWLPSGAGQTSCSQAYVYNSLVKDWTYWQKSATCGLLNPSTKLLALGCGDENTVRVENKTYLRADFVDGTLTFNTNGGSAGDVVAFNTFALKGRITVGSVVDGSPVLLGKNLLVTAVNLLSNTFTCAGTGLGDAVQSFGPVLALTMYEPVSNVVALVPSFAGTPDSEKQWREAKWHFSFFDISVPAFAFNTEHNSLQAAGPSSGTWPQYSGVLENGALPPVVLRVDVPEECERGVLLYPSFSVAEPFALWRLCGLTSTAEPGSERSGN